MLRWFHPDRTDDCRIDHRYSRHSGGALIPIVGCESQRGCLASESLDIRDVLDQHKADQGKYPPSLLALVGAGYMRGIPKDPFTGATTTWQEISDPGEGGVVDVFSGAEFIGTDGTPYNRW